VSRKNRHKHKEPTPTPAAEAPPAQNIKLEKTDSTPRTNGLTPPSEAPPEEQSKPKNPQATVQEHNPGKTESNVKGRKAAVEALEFIYSEFKEKLTPAFWEHIRDEAMAKVGMPLLHPTEVKIMSEKNAKIFEKTKLEYGRYTGKTILHAFKKEPGYLHELTFKPDPFQRELRRYLAYQATLKPAKTAGKAS
jgi:hypothetical protein